jgi:hypothetical protein
MPSLEFDGEVAYSSRPIIPVRFVNPTGGLAFDSYGLVDSGADKSLLTPDTLAFLGYEIALLPRVRTSGTAGAATAFEVEILMELFGVAFLASALVLEHSSVHYNLLGRDPLFQHVHFAFEEYAEPWRNRVLWKLP